MSLSSASLEFRESEFSSTRSKSKHFSIRDDKYIEKTGLKKYLQSDEHFICCNIN